MPILSILHARFGAVSLFLSFWLSALLLVSDSLVLDEFEHIGSGYAYVHEANYALNVFHPPLVKLLAGLGVSVRENHFSSPPPQVNERLSITYAKRLFSGAGNNTNTLKTSARIPVFLFNFVLTLILYCQLRSLLPKPGGDLIITFLSLSPLFLGHAHLVTMDVPIALVTALTITSYMRFIISKNNLDGWKSAFYSCVGLTIKYNSLLCTFVLFSYSVTRWILNNNVKERKSELKFLLTLVITTLFTLSFLAFLTASHTNSLRVTETIERSFAVERLPQFHFGELLDPPLILYRRIKLLILHVFTAPTASTYFLGEIGRRGNYTYFPTLFICKELPVFLIFVFVGLSLFFKSLWHTRKLSQELRVVVLYLTLSLILFSLISLQTGLRYILPLYVPILILSAHGFLGYRNRRRKLILLSSVLAGIATIQSIFIFPHHLSYFNSLSRIWGKPHEIAADSNLDWGQNNARFVSDYRTQSHAPLYVDFVGPLHPSSYINEDIVVWNSLAGRPPLQSIFAISAFKYAWYLSPSYRPKKGGDLAWLKNAKVIGNHGNSILLFKIQ